MVACARFEPAESDRIDACISPAARRLQARSGDPTGRQLTWNVSACAEPFRYLIRDRDQKFTHQFDEVFRGARCEIIRTPFRAPAGKRSRGALRTNRWFRLSRLAADCE
jgi:hypothetical protein